MSRFDLQQHIEEELVGFAPALDESEELLDAWFAGLEAGCDEDLSEIEHYYKRLKQAITETVGNVYVYEPDECTLAKLKAESEL